MVKPLELLLKSLSAHPVIDPKILYKDYMPLDLSITNTELQAVDVSSVEAIQAYIDEHLKKHNAKVAFGGYNEIRGIYARSAYFNQNNSETERNVHLGLDLWVAAGTAVHAPLNASIHSFKNNTNYGDYGPTIILKHQQQGIDFYTLYGHLSTASLEGLKVGQVVKKGQQIATLGLPHENGDYAPHLHFQIIKDIKEYLGDYPGVSNKLERDFYLGNCPNPLVLINF